MSSLNKPKILWRKPFIDYIDLNRKKNKISNENLNYLRSQIKGVLNSLLSLSRDYHKLFIDPISQFKLTKIRQLRIAKKHFDILPYEFSILDDYKKIQNSITKPLGNAKVGEEILYTTRFDQGNAYRPFPWFFQKGLLNGKDITCVYINKEIFFYECEYKRSKKNIDWRIEINKKKQSKWKKFKHKKLTFYKKGVISLMKNFELNYGRLDFILADDTLYFLECNPNGQFGWLDDFSTLKLHKKFLNAFIKY